MIFFDFFIIIFLPLLLGIFVLKFFLKDHQLNVFLYLGLSYSLGLGIISQWMFLIGALGLPFDVFLINGPLLIIVSILALILYRQGRLKNIFSSFYAVKLNFSFFDLTGFLIIIFFCVYTIMMAVIFIPVSAWDVVATIAFKAKFFFYEQTFQFNKGLPHASYPLHMPLLLSWAAFCLGKWHEYYVKLVVPLHFIALIFSGYGFLREFAGRKFALLGILLLCFSNYVILHSIFCYRDLPLALYNCSAIFLIILWQRYKLVRFLVLAGVFSGMSTFVKLEGIGYAVIHSVFLLSLFIFSSTDISLKNFWKKVKGLLCFFTPMLLFILAYQIFKIIYDVPLGESGKTELLMGFELFFRLPIVVSAFLKNMFWSNYWGWNWILFGVCSLFSINTITKTERSLIVVIFLFLSAHAVLFLFTPNYVYLETPGFDVLLPRLILHVFPLCPILTALMLYRFFPEWRDEY